LQPGTTEEEDAVADEFDAVGLTAAALLLAVDPNAAEELLEDEPQPTASSAGQARISGRRRRGIVSMAAQG